MFNRKLTTKEMDDPWRIKTQAVVVWGIRAVSCFGKRQLHRTTKDKWKSQLNEKVQL